ncbi:MAG: hypothetical protein ACTSPN_02495 [Promethearchaeota archaeon]
MIELKTYKWPIITVLVIVAALMLVLATGFTIGFLSENPDGLERVLIDIHGEEWLENLISPWVPILSFITNDYVAGIIGIVLSITLMTGVFYLISKKKEG